MFTGIVEEIGTVISIDGSSCQDGTRLRIRANKVLENTMIGDSIAVNGVCLTVISMGSAEFCADVMSETLRRSSLGSLKNGSGVNLERAMSAEGRFGGHIVSGHIDGTGKIERLQKEGIATWIYISASTQILNLIVEKGSIAIDGISLTVAKVSSDNFAVSIIPHTASQTTLLSKKEGDLVNLENDVIGKYVQKLIQNGTGLSGNDSLGNDSCAVLKEKKLAEWLES